MNLVPAERLRRQIALVLSAWGMHSEQVEVTADIMVDTDLRGIDSHGVSMLPVYDEWRQKGWLRLPAEISVVRDVPAVAVIDAGGGLGHAPSVAAMRLAVAKAKAIGLGATAVRRSTHFGAAGYYARLAAAEGLIGISTTNGQSARLVPTFGADPVTGTNPLAFAAPAARQPPFVLDMATSTVAVGKIRNLGVEGKPIPIGWGTDRDGRPTADARLVWSGGGHVTPLGGTPELSSHKGYGLAMMVEILSAMLSGALVAPTRPRPVPIGAPVDNGHFFLAIDPKAFRPEGGFEEELDGVIDALRRTRPIDPAQPVLVHGDKEEKSAKDRVDRGIPVPPGLMDLVRRTARGANAEFVL
jgi:LDH2 family malate/lactate/ureidoglycolate dehydrogenase